MVLVFNPKKTVPLCLCGYFIVFRVPAKPPTFLICLDEPEAQATFESVPVGVPVGGGLTFDGVGIVKLRFETDTFAGESGKRKLPREHIRGLISSTLRRSLSTMASDLFIRSYARPAGGDPWQRGPK